MSAADPTRPLDEFGYVMNEVGTEFLFANGIRATQAIGDEKLAKMASLLGVRPRRVEDYMKLLAIVNRRVAARDTTVSPFCKVSFISEADRTVASRTFSEHGEIVPFDMPFILGGINLTDMARRNHEMLIAADRGQPAAQLPDNAQMNAEQRRRP